MIILKVTYLSRGSNDFDEIWYGDAVRNSGRARPSKFEISKIQDGGGRHFEKSKNTIFRPRFKRFR